MVLDKLFEFASPDFEKKCPYAKNCVYEGIKACYENYERCTIYQRNKILNQRIEKIVE